MRVAVIDSGVEHDHPWLDDSVKGGVIVESDARRKEGVRYIDEPKPRDLFGHGTACATIIHKLAPEAEIYSVRVLGKDLSGRAIQFAGGLRWAIQNNMHVLNLSLSTAKQEYYGLFHEIADEAYFKNVLLVSAVNNIPAPAIPRSIRPSSRSPPTKAKNHSPTITIPSRPSSSARPALMLRSRG